MILRSLLVGVVALTGSSAVGLARDVRDTRFPERVWMAPPAGMRLVCADDYPNGATGSPGDGRYIKLRSTRREVQVVIASASVAKPIKPNATVAGHAAEILVFDKPGDDLFFAAKYFDHGFFVKVDVTGEAAIRNDLDSFVAQLTVRSLDAVKFAIRDGDVVVYDGRFQEGAYLPFYEFSFLGSHQQRLLVRVVGFPERLNPKERIVRGDTIAVGPLQALAFTAMDKVNAVSWNPRTGVSVTVYGPNLKRDDVVAAARRTKFVGAADWKSKTTAVARSFPDRKGWSRCTRAT